MACSLTCVFTSPELLTCLTYVSLVCLCCDKPRLAAALLASRAPANAAVYGITPLWAFHPACGALIFSVFLVLGTFWDKRYTIYVTTGLLALCAASAYHCHWDLPAVKYDREIARQFMIGEALETISGELGKNGTLQFNHDTMGAPLDKCKALYLDHDCDSEWACGNFQQDRPWSANLPFGPCFLALAIGKDGYYAANLGARLACKENGILLSLFQNGVVVPICQLVEDRPVFADSDIFCNGIVPYQRNILSAICGKNTGLLAAYTILVSSCLVALWFRKCRYLKVGIPIAFTLAYLITGHIPHSGEVRYTGPLHHWPHTTLGEGVVRQLQGQGHNVFFGEKNGVYLVIAGGYHAVRETERVVILEPGASVTINGKTVHANTIPLGSTDGVEDARNISVGDTTYGPHAIIDGIEIIASGSPGKLNYNELLTPSHP